MSTGVILTLVAVALALVIAGLFRLVAVLDSAELGLRRLVAEVRAARKTVASAGQLAVAVEDAVTGGQGALGRLEELKHRRPASEN